MGDIGTGPHRKIILVPEPQKEGAPAEPSPDPVPETAPSAPAPAPIPA